MIRWVAVSTFLSSDRHGWGRAESQRRNSGPEPVPSWQAGAGLSCPDLHLGAPGSLTEIVSKKEGLAAHYSKANKETRLIKKESLLYFRCCQLVWGAGVFQKANSHLPPAPAPNDSRARAFTGSWGWAGYIHIFRLVIGDLTSIILIVLGTVNLQFQGEFVSISLRPVLRTVAAYIMTTVWSLCS